VISGRLTSKDMRRLEYVCAGALILEKPKLDIHLGAVTYADATARAILRHFERRGIRLIDAVQLSSRDVALSPRHRHLAPKPP
jgi:hypothetical protein